MLANVGEDGPDRAHTKRLMPRNREMVLALFVRVQPHVAASLPGHPGAQSHQDLGEVIAREVSGKPHTASSRSWTRWRRMMRGRYEKDFMGESLFSRILAYTSAACDARMAGEKIPVMSNSGSGNQGISATLPVVIYAEEKGKSEEELARALILSHLTAIYIKNHMGRLAAFCGCVVAATGSSCGMT